MCGEAINKDAFKRLDPLVPEHVVNVIRSYREHYPGGRTIEAKVNGYILDRPAFIRGIISKFRALGGTFLQEGIISVERGSDEFVITASSGERFSSKYLIGADGAHSIVRRTLFKEEPAIMHWAEQYVVKKDIPRDVMQFYQDQRYGGGYRWEFPCGELTKIGFPRGTDTIDTEILEVHRRAIPGGGVARLVDGNVCLVGDSAGQTNPMTGGGIRMALEAGKSAAEAIVQGDLTRYERWWKRSPYSYGGFLDAYYAYENMTNEELENTVRPFSRGYNILTYGAAWLARPGLRDLLKANRLAGSYGW